MNVSEVIAQAVVDEGVVHVFALLGDTNMHFLAALDELRFSGIHTCRHEGNSMAEADGCARASGDVAVCAVTAGPGFVNILNSLTGAVRAHAPVVVFTGQHSRDDLKNPQWIDHEGLTRLTGAGYQPISSAGNALDATRMAFYRARTEQIPVVLDVPMDIQHEEFPWPYAYEASSWSIIPVQRVSADPLALERAARVLDQSERPIILAGTGAEQAGAAPALIQLADRVGALLSTTLLSRGLFHGHPFDVGVAGLFSSPVAAELFAATDVVVGVGASLNHFTTEGGYLFPNAQVIQVDIRPQALMANSRSADVFVCGDARVAAEQLAAHPALTERPRYRSSSIAEDIATRAVDGYEIELEPDRADPRRVCEVLDAALPSECGVVIGCGHFWTFPIMHMLRRRRPQLFTYQFGSVGQALAVGIGASVARPGDATVIIEGDGSVMMNVSALETLAVQKARVLLVVLNDWALGAEVNKLTASGMDPRLGYNPQTDIARVANAFGCRSAVVTDAADMKSVVDEFLVSEGPMVVDCRTSRRVISAPHRKMHYGLDH